MALSESQRRSALGGALALTLAIAAWVHTRSGEQGAGTAPPRPRAATVPALAAAPARDLARIERPPPDADSIKDIFAKHSWYVPPPPAAAAPPAPPPLPFTFFGKAVIQDAGIVVFLAEEGRYHVVRTGDVVGGNYRVDAISPTTMTLTYLPLGRQQQLEIGRAK